MFSHVFAATVVVSFVLLGLWQWSRHNWRADLNAEIEARSTAPALEVSDALDRPVEELDYRAATGPGSYVDGDLVRVANRSQGGVAGEHMVALFRLDDGQLILVNRGFVPVNTDVELVGAPTGPVTVTGWLRASAEPGWFGPADSGEGDVVPRLDVDAIESRVGEPLAPVWLQLAGSGDAAATSREFPDPVPLPELDGGPHLSYMGQWFIFAVLGTLFYGALLRRQSRQSAAAVAQPV